MEYFEIERKKPDRAEGLTRKQAQMPTILIVDDDASNRMTLMSILEPEGYELALAENGFQALELARKMHPDVILLDVMMPGMDGFEVCRLIRNEAALAEIPILFLTALDDHQSRLDGLSYGADAYITKPFNRQELRTLLKTIAKLDRYRKLMDDRRELETAHSELLMAYDETIEGWSRAMDLRDKETEGHTRRVTVLTLELSRFFDIEKDDLVHIRRGALLHDIGKLGVPDSILLKPTPLNSEEWQIMRQHPQMAYDMLYQIRYLRPALDIPYCHHEKWDGTGYPRGLAGEKIPLTARIFSVIDVWDALTSDRPYRARWSQEASLQYLLEQSGVHFDPQVVTAFFKLIETEPGIASSLSSMENKNWPHSD